MKRAPVITSEELSAAARDAFNWERLHNLIRNQIEAPPDGARSFPDLHKELGGGEKQLRRKLNALVEQGEMAMGLYSHRGGRSMYYWIIEKPETKKRTRPK